MPKIPQAPEGPQTYASTINGNSFVNSSKVDVRDIPVIDVPIPIKYQTKDGNPTIHFTIIEMQRSDAIFLICFGRKNF